MFRGSRSAEPHTNWWSPCSCLAPGRFRSYISQFPVPPDGTSRFLYEVWQPLYLLLLTFAFTLGFFSSLKPTTKAPSPLFCDVNGIVQELGPDATYRPIWDLNLFFTVNIPYGSFSFTGAKLIDACWDIGFGRGGQVVASMLAYRVVRRSLTLTLEDSAVLLPTAASMCCQQLQVATLWELLRAVYVRPNKRPTPRNRPWIVGLTRRVSYVFICTYVLVFATLTSVMTGYRAGLTGYFGYAADQDSTMKPLENVTRPEFVLYDPHRINLTEELVSTVEGLPGYQTLELYWDAYSKLEQKHASLKETWPTKAEIIQPCESFYQSICNLSLPAGAQSWDQAESNISVGLEKFTLPAPLLDIRKNKVEADGSSFQQRLGQDPSLSNIKLWSYSGIVFSDGEVRNTSLCIASEQYSWGLSSMLLLTFCVYTMLFSACLILLQAEVYWYSRSDRLNLSTSIYSDILFLADAIQTRFGQGVWDLSVQELDKKVRDHQGGISVEVDMLPCSRMAMRSRRKRRTRQTEGTTMQKLAPAKHVGWDDSSEVRLVSGSFLENLEMETREELEGQLSSSQETKQSLKHSVTQPKGHSRHKDSKESTIEQVALCSGGLQDDDVAS